MLEPQDPITGVPPTEGASTPEGAPASASGATPGTGAAGPDPTSQEGGSGAGSGGGQRSVDVQWMIGELQGMITKVAAVSEPALREVAAKAAELAAVAAKRAGPIAHTLADRTEEASRTVAVRASGFATSLRAGRTDLAEEPDADGFVAEPSTTTGVAPEVSDPAEDSPRDGA